MTHVTHPRIRTAPSRSRAGSVSIPHARAMRERKHSLAAPLTLAAIVVSTPLVAAAVALGGALAA